MANPAAVRAYVVAMGQTRLAYALCPNCGAESRDQTVTIRHVLDCHVTAFTPGVFQIAISRYFQPVAMEYLIDQRSLTGFKGKIRNWILRVSRINQKLEKYFKERWGYNQIWILKKKNAPR